MGSIYKITNNANGKIYIGLTKRTLEERWKGHIIESRRDEGRRRICRAIRKYGENSFTMVELESVNESDMPAREIFYISKYDSTNPTIGYNLSEGGEGNTLGGSTLSEEQRLHRSNLMKERLANEDPEVKALRMKKFQEAGMSPESMAKKAAAHKLRDFSFLSSDENKAKIKLGQQNRAKETWDHMRGPRPRYMYTFENRETKQIVMTTSLQVFAESRGLGAESLQRLRRLKNKAKSITKHSVWIVNREELK